MLRIQRFRKLRKMIAVLGSLMIAALIGLPMFGVVHADSVTSTVTVGAQPHGIAVDSNSKFVYVANMSAATVSYWDSTASPITVHTITGVGSASLSEGPLCLAITPDNSQVWATVPALSEVVIISTSTDAVVTTVAVPSAQDVAFDSAGTNGYVTEGGASKKCVQIPTSTDVIHKTWNVGGGATGLVVLDLSGTNTVYVANTADSTVSVFVPGVTSTTGTVPIVSDSGATISSPTFMTNNGDGAHVYVLNIGNDSVSVITTSTNTCGTPIADSAGNGINDIAWAQTATDKKLYISNGGDAELQIYNLDTVVFKPALTVGTNPTFVCAAPNGSTIYVANSNAGTVSVITTT
jgi:DNA-binding beta-propeller fold protein YncE